MARIALLSAAVLVANLGVDGSPASSCGPETAKLDTLSGETDAPDGGMTDDAGTSDGGGRPDGGGMGTGSGKVPHLINIMTGEDLGALVALPTLTVYYEKADALIELGAVPPTQSGAVYFPEKDCNGKRYIQSGPPKNPPALTNKIDSVGPLGTYLKPTGPLMRDPPILSFVRNSGYKIGAGLECINYTPPAGKDYTEYVDTGMKPRPPDNQLKVELR